MTAYAGQHRAWPQWLTRLRLLHPFPSFVVTVVTGAIALYAGGRDDLSIAAALALAMLCFQFSIGLTNDLVDREEDAVRKPWKPLAAGLVAPRAALAAAISLVAAGFAIIAPLGLAVVAIGGLGLGCGLAYDLYFRRTPLSWLPYAVALPLVPVWAHVAVDQWDAMLWWVFPLGAVLGLALHLANQAPDAEASTTGSSQGLAGLLGRRRSYAGAAVAFALGAGAAAVVLAPRSISRSGAIIAIAAMALVASPLAPRWLGRDSVFAIFALATAAIAILFLSSL